MDLHPIDKMIADLESIGALDSSGNMSPEEVSELGADYIIASSPRIKPPGSLEKRVFARIHDQPARVTTDPAGRILEINPAFSGLCGFSFAEIAGRKPGSFLQGPETDPEAVEVIREAVKRESGCTTTLVNYHKDGTRYLVRIEIEPLRDGSGRLLGFRATETKIS